MAARRRLLLASQPLSARRAPPRARSRRGCRHRRLGDRRRLPARVDALAGALGARRRAAATRSAQRGGPARATRRSLAGAPRGSRDAPTSCTCTRRRPGSSGGSRPCCAAVPRAARTRRTPGRSGPRAGRRRGSTFGSSGSRRTGAAQSSPCRPTSATPASRPASGGREQYRVIPNGVDVGAVRRRARAGTRPRPLPRPARAAEAARSRSAGARARARRRAGSGQRRAGPRAGSSSSPTELGVAERVRFLGYRDDVPALLARAVVPARDKRLRGRVARRARGDGRGRPGRRDPGRRRRRGAGRRRAVVERGDVDAVAGALARVLGDGDEAARLGEAGRARAAAEFTRERMVASTVALWEELAGG